MKHWLISKSKDSFVCTHFHLPYTKTAIMPKKKKPRASHLVSGAAMMHSHQTPQGQPQSKSNPGQFNCYY